MCLLLTAQQGGAQRWVHRLLHLALISIPASAPQSVYRSRNFRSRKCKPVHRLSPEPSLGHLVHMENVEATDFLKILKSG